jgi:diguanylate cyclase (GGDEF)-like protein/putative nucleotidyltransferase with HDIG domain
MPSWSSRLAEGTAAQRDMLRRFVEASRRAEIVALVNSARSEAELGEVVSAELCEAYEAEVAFVVAAPSEGAPPEIIGATGLDDAAGIGLLREPLVVNVLTSAEPDVTQPASRAAPGLLGIGAEALVLAPFATPTGERAVVGVARLYEQPFDEAEVALLEAVTASVGHALERLWIASERDRRAAQQAALASAARTIHASLELDQVLATLCAEVVQAFSADIAVVSFGDDRDGHAAVAAHGLPEGFLGFSRDPGEGLSGRAIATGEPALSNAYGEDGHLPATTAALRGVRSAVAVPLRRSAAVDGALEVAFRRDHWVGPADAELLGAFAELAAVACRNADDLAAAQRAAARDSLTGCLNHGALQSRLREEISRAERGGEPFTIALIDLDDFKEINERFGHLAGDTVLRSVGELLRSSVRLHDQVARFGGDEFALLLTGANEADAHAVVGRALAALRDAPLPTGRDLCASAGLAHWRLGEQATSLIDEADQALRAAKRERRRDVGAARPVIRASDEHPAAGVDDQADERWRVQRRLRRLATASALGAKLTRLLDPQVIADVAAEDLHEVLGFPRCSVAELHDGQVVSIANAGRDQREPPFVQPQDEGAIGRCLRERRPVLVHDSARDPLYRRALEAGTRSELAVPLYVGGRLWGAIDVRSARVSAFDPDDAQLVQTVADHVGAALHTAQLYQGLEDSYLGTAEALAAALEAKDDYTADHARSIAVLAVAMGRELGLDDAAVRDLRLGAVFHDIGKIAVPDAILHKPGPLTEDERRIMEGHSVAGEQILRPVPFFGDVRKIVRHDHERWDGTGYPDGLRGPEIPLGARIVFVVDAYHAMTSDRPYRRALPVADALEELQQCAGTQFDPDVVEAFLRVLGRR